MEKQATSGFHKWISTVSFCVISEISVHVEFTSFAQCEQKMCRVKEIKSFGNFDSVFYM